MKILAVTDQVVERLYTLAVGEHFREVRLILGCGDLPSAYLEYLLTMLNVPLGYVPGNHDIVCTGASAVNYVGGGINLDGRVVRVKGLLLAGLGGSIRYRPDGINQYTQMEMYLRVLGLFPGLLWNRLRYGRALDILISHSPPFGINDDDSSAHRGLLALNFLIRWAKPRYHLHGHMHVYNRNLEVSTTTLGSTQVVNVFPYQVLEIPDE